LWYIYRGPLVEDFRKAVSASFAGVIALQKLRLTTGNTQVKQRISELYWIFTTHQSPHMRVSQWINNYHLKFVISSECQGSLGEAQRGDVDGEVALLPCYSATLLPYLTQILGALLISP
jgi:hypothetical protein